MSSSPVFSGVRVTRSSVLYVCFVDHCLFFCTFSFGHCVVCSSSIYGFWVSLWYLKTLLIKVLSQMSVEFSLMSHKLLLNKAGLIQYIRLKSLRKHVFIYFIHIKIAYVYLFWCFCEQKYETFAVAAWLYIQLENMCISFLTSTFKI